MIPVYLGLILIIAAIVIALLFAKGVLIWRDVMMKQNEVCFNDADKLRSCAPASDQPPITCPCCGSDKTYRTEAIHCNRCAVTTEI